MQTEAMGRTSLNDERALPVFLAGASREYSHGGYGAVNSLPITLSPATVCQEVSMHCPFCKHEDTRVVDSREADEGQAIRRRRSCPQCSRRFSTVETAVLSVVKRNGISEPFSRDKLIKGVRRACQGRDVSDDSLYQLAQQVEDSVRAGGSAEILSNEVGLAILQPLKELDKVAYLRFASVYRSFDSVEDFEQEIAELRSVKQLKN